MIAAKVGAENASLWVCAGEHKGQDWPRRRPSSWPAAPLRYSGKRFRVQASPPSGRFGWSAVPFRRGVLPTYAVHQAGPAIWVLFSYRRYRAFSLVMPRWHVSAQQARELAAEGESEPGAAEALRGCSVGLAVLLE